MGLAWRWGCLDDLPGCLALLRGHSAYDPATLERLSTVWRRLLDDAALIVGVVEDESEPRNRRLLAFGASVFVTDAFMAREREGEAPYLSARAIRGELHGPSVILRPPAICAAQTRGPLNLLSLLNAEVGDGLDPNVQQQMRFAMFEAFVTQHKGYRIKDVLRNCGVDARSRGLGQRDVH